MFSSTEPFGSSVTGVQRGLWARGLQLDCGLVGQSGVLAPWGVTVVAAPGPLGHLASICNGGVNLILSYLFINLFIYLEYLYRLAQFGFEKQVYIASINDNKARWPHWEPHSLLFVEVYEFFYSLTPGSDN